MSAARTIAAITALLVFAGCSDPLPADVQWLAGRWRWTGSCCTIAGTGPVPTLGNELFIDFHHNGTTAFYYRGDTLRTRYSVDVGEDATWVRFFQAMPAFNRARTFLMTRTAADRIVLHEYPDPCDDCPDTHAFVRID
jgi:hypothetical protein